MTKRVSDPQAVYQSAVALFGQGRFREARKLLLGLDAAYPNNPVVLRLLGMSLCELRQYDHAIDCLRLVAEIDPSAPDLFNLGKALQIAQRYDDALAAHEVGLRLAPGDPTLAQARAATLLQMGRIEEAAALLRELLQAHPGNLEAATNLANALVLLRQPSEALRLFRAVATADPSIRESQSGPLLRAKLLTCDWLDFDAVLASVVRIAECGEEVNPSTLLTVIDDPALHLKAARASTRAGRAKPLSPPLTRRERIRIAYVSGDFRKHATTHLVAELFELHDRSRFEIVAVSTGADDSSPERLRVMAGVDTFLDLAGASPREIAGRVRALDVDIALDMMGHTARSLVAAFNLRLAPVQVNFLGYPGTSGSPEIDYIVLDRYLACESVLRNLSEQPVVLPHCYQPNDRKRPLPQQALSRSDYGLPEHGFVYCAFNNTGKVTPSMFASWTRILQAVEGSVLWLFATDPVAVEALRGEAARAGIDPARLVFADHRPVADHLARYLVADLFLDTFPYGAHTTGSDALWMSCPLITVSGGSFASRVAGSLLHTVGLPELVTRSLAAYETLAIELARSPGRLAGHRRHLADVRAATPLFDAPLYARGLERAYAEMHRRRTRALKTAPIDLTR